MQALPVQPKTTKTTITGFDISGRRWTQETARVPTHVGEERLVAVGDTFWSSVDCQISLRNRPAELWVHKADAAAECLRRNREWIRSRSGLAQLNHNP